MEHLKSFKELAGARKPSKITNERQALIEMFVLEVNKSRLGTDWKPLTKMGIKRLAMDINRHPMLKSNQELKDFYDLCKRAKSFSGKLYGTVRPKLSTP